MVKLGKKDNYYEIFSRDDDFSTEAHVGSKQNGYPDLGPYSQSEVTSALRKEIKLNDLDKAIWWTEVMLHFGDASWIKKVARQLWIMAAEDLHDDKIVADSAQIYKHVGRTGMIDDYVLYDIVSRACVAEKWWETEHGRNVDYYWGKAQGDLRRGKPYPNNMNDIFDSVMKAIEDSDLESAMFYTHLIVDIAGTRHDKIHFARMLFAESKNYSQECQDRANALYSMVGDPTIGETDHYFFLVGKMAMGYEQTYNREALHYEDSLDRARKMIERGEFYTMPTYAVDRHTLRGIIFMNKHGQEMDNRFNGTEIGRAKTVYLYKKYGDLSRDYYLDDEGYEAVSSILDLYGGGLSTPRLNVKSYTDQERLF